MLAGVLAVAALALALRAPLDVVVVGILLVGMPHVLFELRHVLGRYVPVLHGRFLVGLNVVLAAIVLERALLPAALGRRVELGLALVLLGAGVLRLHGHRRVVAGVAVAVVGALAITQADQWFLVVAHLHNVVPVVFLWEWSATHPAPRRRAIRCVAVGLLLGVPLALALGAADRWLAMGGSLPLDAGTQGGVVASVVPAGSAPRWTLRLLAAFAFAQLAHYAVWCWFLPRHARPDVAAFEATPVGGVLGGRRLLVVAMGAAAAVTALALIDYRQGRQLYTALASYHAYLELPLLVLVLAGGRTLRSPHP